MDPKPINYNQTNSTPNESNNQKSKGHSAQPRQQIQQMSRKQHKQHQTSTSIDHTTKTKKFRQRLPNNHKGIGTINQSKASKNRT